MSQSGGTLSGTGTVTVTGATTLTGGAQTGAGTTVAKGGLTLGTAGFSQFFLDTGRVLENAGAGAAVGTQTDLLLNEPSSGTAATTFRNNVGATFDDQTTGSGLFIADEGSAALVDNQGTWKKTGSAATSAISAAFNNSGTVDVESGTLDLSGGGTSSGTFKGAAGATVAFGGTTTLTSASSVTGPNVTFESGTATVAGSYAVTGTTSVTGGTVNFNSPTATTAGLSQSGGTLSGTGTVTVTGATTRP